MTKTTMRAAAERISYKRCRSLGLTARAPEHDALHERDARVSSNAHCGFSASNIDLWVRFTLGMRCAGSRMEEQSLLQCCAEGGELPGANERSKD